MGSKPFKLVHSADDSVDSAAPSGGSLTVREAAGRSQRELLVALRDKIAGDIDAGVPARDLASLSKRLLEITEQIGVLDAEDASDDVSDAAATPDESW